MENTAPAPVGSIVESRGKNQTTIWGEPCESGKHRALRQSPGAFILAVGVGEGFSEKMTLNLALKDAKEAGR